MSADDPDPVVVVGLGPVGATVALLLAAQGVRVLALERDAAVYPHPRAVALDDEALRVLQAAGVLRGDGLPLLPGGVVRLTGRDGATLVELPPPPTTTGHPALAFFRQPELERRLRERLAEEPLIEVRLGYEVVGVAQDGAGATVTVRRRAAPGDVATTVPAGDAPVRQTSTNEELRASWVLACDGGRSGVRAGLGIRLRGATSGRRWLVVDGDEPPADGVGVRALGDFTFACEPARPWVHGALPGGAHRWEFLLGAGEEDAALRRPDVVAALLARRHGGAAPPVGRAAVYAFHARVAPRWRVGRVLLLGDAAHLSPPFAGQGLGAGLRDAGNVAWKLAAAVRGEADEALLDSYARERLPHVLRTTALALGLGLLVQVRRARLARVRDVAIARLARVGRVRAWMVRGGWRPSSRIGGALVGRGPHAGRAGEPLPQPWVRTAGGTIALDDALGPDWALIVTAPAGVGGPDDATGAGIGPGVPPISGVRPRVLGPAAPGSGYCGRFPADPPIQVGVGAPLDDGGALAAWIDPAEVVLVRPDRVVFGTAPAAGVDGLLAAARAAASGRSRRRPFSR